MGGTMLLVLAAVSVLTGMIYGGAMIGHIAKRGEKINYIWIKLYFFKYVQTYRRMTREETGKVGPYFMPFFVFMNLALVLAMVALVTRA